MRICWMHDWDLEHLAFCWRFFRLWSLSNTFIPVLPAPVHLQRSLSLSPHDSSRLLYITTPWLFEWSFSATTASVRPACSLAHHPARQHIIGNKTAARSHQSRERERERVYELLFWIKRPTFSSNKIACNIRKNRERREGSDYNSGRPGDAKRSETHIVTSSVFNLIKRSEPDNSTHCLQNEDDSIPTGMVSLFLSPSLRIFLDFLSSILRMPIRDSRKEAALKNGYDHHNLSLTAAYRPAVGNRRGTLGEMQAI